MICCFLVLSEERSGRDPVEVRNDLLDKKRASGKPENSAPPFKAVAE